MLTRLIGLMVIWAIWGCGMMGNPKEEEKVNLSAPQKVSMEMPKELKSEKQKRTARLRKVNENKSLGYTFLKEDVAQVEENVLKLEQSLLFINQVIDEIDSKCKAFEFNSTCVIEADILSFTIDKNLSKEINDSNFMVGDEIVFGKVAFKKYPLTETYQYEIKLDYTFIETELATETIKWSADKKRVVSLYDEETKEEALLLDLAYEIKADGTQEIEIDDVYFNKETNSSDDLKLNIVKKGDKERYYEVKSENKMLDYLDGEAEQSSFSTEGILSSDGGYLLFIGEYKGLIFKEKELFDGEGEHISTRYCDSDMECDMEEEESWERE